MKKEIIEAVHCGDYYNILISAGVDFNNNETIRDSQLILKINNKNFIMTKTRKIKFKKTTEKIFKFRKSNFDAQELQDEIFKKMSAQKKISLTSDCSMFCLKLNKLRE